jgi:hypothetical protein
MASSSFCWRLPFSSATNAVLVVLILSVVASMSPPAGGGCNEDLTAGFVKVDLPESSYAVQRPYDVPVDQRYRYDDHAAVRTFVLGLRRRQALQQRYYHQPPHRSQAPSKCNNEHRRPS